MASITFDGQSFLLDGRREWRLAATVHYNRIPHQDWESRLRLARDAGFGAIVAPVVWSAHEPRRGAFDWKGDRNLRAFVTLIGRLGMRCVLRVGPFIGSTDDMGGLPAWVGSSSPPIDGRAGVRSATPAFLEAVSRWIGEVSEQVRDLQATVRDGPILLMQAEHEWFCGHDEAASEYLGELNRYLRESGFLAPVVNCNNLYTQIEGEIDGWSGPSHLLQVARQLREVFAAKPAMITEWAPGASPAWGEAVAPEQPEAIQRSLAEALAAGAMVNVSRFCEGTHFGFDGGRSSSALDRFFTPSGGPLSLVTEDGRFTRSYLLVKRIATFARSFARVFAHLDPSHRPAAIMPGAGGASVVHCRGSRGSIIMIMGDEALAKQGSVELLLPDGASMHAPISGQWCGWRLLDTHITGRSTLEQCNLDVFAQVGRALVLFGPPGARASLSIGGAIFESAVPTGKTPTIEEHEGVLLVLCTEAMIDASIATEDAVHIGVRGLDGEDQPLPHPDFRTRFTIRADGSVEKSAAAGPATPAPGKPPSLRDWASAPATAYVDGTSERYATIDAPKSLTGLGVLRGYGWMRVKWSARAAKKPRLGLHECDDRAHVFLDGAAQGVAGSGPGASWKPITVSVGKGDHVLTLLLDNLGRTSGGSHLGEPKGLHGPLWEVTPLKVGKPEIRTATPIDPFDFQTPLFGLRKGERTDARRVSWTIQHRRKSPIAVVVGAYVGPSLLVVNDAPVRLLEPMAVERITLLPEMLKQGKNIIEIALLAEPGGGADVDSALATLAGAVSFDECAGAITEGAELAFAKWEPPAASAFTSVKGLARAAATGVPTWWRAGFKSPDGDSPLFFDATGLSKGHLFLNGREASRYFVATGAKKSVGPQTRCYLPSAWLRKSGSNEILIFDEHGFTPNRCRLVGEGDWPGL